MQFHGKNIFCIQERAEEDCPTWHTERGCIAVQEALLQDLEGGEKNTKQLKGHLKDIVQAASGVTPSSRGRIEMPDSNGMAARMSH